MGGGRARRKERRTAPTAQRAKIHRARGEGEKARDAAGNANLLNGLPEKGGQIRPAAKGKPPAASVLMQIICRKKARESHKAKARFRTPTIKKTSIK